MTLLPFDWTLMSSSAIKLATAWLLALPSGFMAEREGHAVGLRTFPIVAIASCGYLLVLQGGPDSQGNSSRVLQGLIAGIGFVGGGAILKDGLTVQGTASAASIWNLGAIGASVAMGHSEIGIILAVLNLLTLKGLVPIKKMLDEKHTK